MNEQEIQVLKKEINWIQQFKKQILEEPEIFEAFKKTYPEMAKSLINEFYSLIIVNWIKSRRIMIKTLKQLDQYYDAKEKEKELLRWMPSKY